MQQNMEGRTAHAVLRGMAAMLLLMVIAPLDSVLAQSSQDQTRKDVEEALGRGDAHALLRHAPDRVEIAVLGTSTLYSRAQATYVLLEFFQEYPPVRYAPHEPSVTDGSLFVAGRYFFGDGERHLDVYLRFRRRGDAMEVREVRIERPVR